MNALTHAATGCGQVNPEIDTIIFIGDLAEVDCPDCVRIIEESRSKSRAEQLAAARKAAEQSVEAIIFAQSGVTLNDRVDWVQVARDALTDALDILGAES